MKPTDWIALAGVLTALISTVTASVLTHKEGAASRLERDKDRAAVARERGRTQALATLTPLFAFVADLEAVARASDRDPIGFARYASEKTFNSWTGRVRQIVIGLQVASDSTDTRALASEIVRLVDDAIASAAVELEFVGEELDPDARREAAEQLVECVSRLRVGADRLAELIRESG